MSPWLRAAWHGMGPWKWIGIAAIVTVIVLTPVTARGEAGPPTAPGATDRPPSG